MNLAISTNSSHYKYYLLLHKMWDINNEDNNLKSLCLYAHFIFWMTLVTAILSPLMLFGWLVLKLFRFTYKICSWTNIGKSFIDFIDDELNFSDYVMDASDKMVESPAVILLKIAAKVITVIFTIMVILLFVFFGVSFFIHIFMNIPEYLLGTLYSISLGIFYVCYGIGFIISTFFCWIWIALKWFGIAIAAYAVFLGIMMGMIVSVFLFGTTLIRISKSVSDFLGFKINGFHKAKEDSLERREKIRKLKLERRKRLERLKNEREDRLWEIKRKKENGEIPYSIIERFGQWIKRITISRTAKVKGTSVQVMSGLGVLWETLKSIKHGICPFVEFVNEEDIEEK